MERHLPRDAVDLARHLAADPRRRGEGPLYLLHGDCGAHNFVLRLAHLVAVIDPLPVVGGTVFDLAFAFVSWPGDLALETIVSEAEALERAGLWRPQVSERRRILIEEVVIALYLRVSASLVWHPADTPVYLEAWAYWTDTLRRDRLFCAETDILRCGTDFRGFDRRFVVDEDGLSGDLETRPLVP